MDENYITAKWHLFDKSFWMGIKQRLKMGKCSKPQLYFVPNLQVASGNAKCKTVSLRSNSKWQKQLRVNVKQMRHSSTFCDRVITWPFYSNDLSNNIFCALAVSMHLHWREQKGWRGREKYMKRTRSRWKWSFLWLAEWIWPSPLGCAVTGKDFSNRHSEGPPKAKSLKPL